MGYSGLEHVSCSDFAADSASLVVSAMVEQMYKELEEKGNEYNTAGDVNVALMFCDMIIPVEAYVYVFHSQVIKLAETVIKRLDETIKRAKEWDDDKNKVWHLSEYTRMKKQIEGFIERSGM